jgi:hypothetical protein
MPDDIAALEGELEEKQQRLRDLKSQPMTPEEAQRLAREEPDEFNRRYDAALRAGRPLIAKEATP